MPLGQAIGRWGNYFNQELYGRPTNLPWGIPISPAYRVAGYEQFKYFHPTFLYESLLNLSLFLILLTLQRTRRSALGTTSALYLIGYALIRIAMEQFRIDVTPTLLGVRWPVVVSGVVLLTGLIMVIKIYANQVIAHQR